MPDLIDLATSAFDYENFFSAKLTADMTAGDTDIFMDDIPAASEGVLVIDWDVAASREVVFFNSKTASKVVCPANGRGFDNTTATTHQSGANVIMAPVRAFFRYAQQLATTTEQGWKALGYAPNTVTHNGNGSYTLVFNSVDLTSFISPGMNLEITRTVTAPTSCFSLDGSNDYYVKSSPSGMTFTDDFTVGAWVKTSSYGGANQAIISRFNGTQGFIFTMQTDGKLFLSGYNAASANYSRCISYQSVILDRWVHVAAKLDMSAYTYTNTTSMIYINGMEIPGYVERAGTNPTALVQAGNLEVGSHTSGTTPWGGYITEAFVSSTKLTTANIQELMTHGITSSDVSTYSLVSAFSNGSTTDLNTTNANNLTATNGATTATDSPFAKNGFGTATGTLDFAKVAQATFSTNTTLTVVTLPGNTLPTSGGISSVRYTTDQNAYGLPSNLQSGSVIEWVKEITASKATRTLEIADSRCITPLKNGTITVHIDSDFGFDTAAQTTTWYIYVDGSSKVAIDGIQAPATQFNNATLTYNFDVVGGQTYTINPRVSHTSSYYRLRMWIRAD